jgi:hypothetical protein
LTWFAALRDFDDDAQRFARGSDRWADRSVLVKRPTGARFLNLEQAIMKAVKIYRDVFTKVAQGGV